MNHITDEEKKYKGMGFVPNRDGKNTSARVVTKNGVRAVSKCGRLVKLLIRTATEKLP